MAHCANPSLNINKIETTKKVVGGSKLFSGNSVGYLLYYFPALQPQLGGDFYIRMDNH